MAHSAQAEAANILNNPISITGQKWFRPYLGMAIVTLLFQIWVRSYECIGYEGCGLSFAKAVIWSVIWPASWVVYMIGMPWFPSLLH